MIFAALSSPFPPKPFKPQYRHDLHQEVLCGAQGPQVKCPLAVLPCSSVIVLTMLYSNWWLRCLAPLDGAVLMCRYHV